MLDYERFISKTKDFYPKAIFIYKLLFVYFLGCYYRKRNQSFEALVSFFVPKALYVGIRNKYCYIYARKRAANMKE